jgi:hypothetical protein
MLVSKIWSKFLKPTGVITGSSWLFLCLLVMYLVYATWMAFWLPAFIGPNEPLHYEYIALLRQTGRVPDPTTSTRADERHQPPLYYTTAAIASLPFPPPPLDTELEGNPHFCATHRGNLNPFVHATFRTVPVLYVGRLVSMVLGLLSLIGLYLAARQTLPTDTALLIVSLTAFQPMFLFLSATVNNDLAVTALGSLLIAYTTVLLVQDKSPLYFLLWGALLACAMLAKASAIFLFLLLPTVCLLKWRRSGQIWPALQCGFWGLCGSIPLWSVWLLFNRFRRQDALGIATSLPIRGLLSLSPADFASIVPHLSTIWRSFWLDWSPGNRGYVSQWFYVFWGVGIFTAAIGWFRRSSSVEKQAPFLLSHLSWATPLTGIFLAAKTYMVKRVGFLVPEGRWMLPIVPSLAWVVGTGWARWWPTTSRRRACLLATLAPPVTVLFLLAFWLPDLYPRAQRLADLDQIPDGVHQVEFVYDDAIALRAIQVEPLHINQESDVLLYWHALKKIQTDYTVSLQLLVPNPGDWDRLDWQNSFPGSGLTPTRGWQGGDVYRDRLTLIPRGNLNGPTQAMLGVWLLAKGPSLPVAHSGEPIDIPVAQEVIVYPAVPLTPEEASLPTPVNFDGLFSLIGVDLTREADEVVLTLWWEAQTLTTTDYTIFVHLLDADGRLVAQFDSMPDNARSPTHIWQPGDIVRDIHRLESTLPPGGALLIGAYDLNTMTRLPARQEGQRLPDDAFRIGLP